MVKKLQKTASKKQTAVPLAGSVKESAQQIWLAGLGAFAKAQSVVDTVADKGIFHKNKAARDKSRLAAKVKALALAA